MKKRVVIITETSQNEKALLKLLSFSKSRLPNWDIIVISVLGETKSRYDLVNLEKEKQVIEQVSTLEDFLGIVKTSDIVIGRSSPIIDEVLAFIAAKTEAIIFNKCTNLLFDVDLSSLKVFKDIYGSRIKMVADIKDFTRMLCISFENIEDSFKNVNNKENVRYCSIRNEIIFGDGYESVAEIVPSNMHSDLNEAAVVISGGRGIKSKEDFQLLRVLSDKIGGALGASRAIVDEGFIGEEAQVGQTGKTVRPDFYLAFGISGTMQHVAGMRNSKTIIAVNKDPKALIFQYADYGILHDYKEIVLGLIDRLNSR